MKRYVILIAYLIFVVQLSDVLQYVWGKLLGRTKVAPNLSPSKTWEGLIGGTWQRLPPRPDIRRVADERAAGSVADGL